MLRDAKKRIYDAVQACQSIAAFIAGRTMESLSSDLMLRSALERQFEILGEALKHAEVLEPTLTNQVPDLRRIIGMRNRLIHGYDQVDYALLWATATEKVEPVRRALQKLLDDNPG